MDKIVLEEPSRLKELLQGAVKVLNSEVTGVKFKIPGAKILGDSVGDVGIISDNDKFSLYDILTRNVRYRLGNFSAEDAKAIVERLTERTYFHLEPALIEQLVRDLAGNEGEVRPIELQIVGAQLQAENITKLAEYQACGRKEELVKRYLAEVVKDCGAENEQAAELVLYLLTDEKGTRPFRKTPQFCL